MQEYKTSDARRKANKKYSEKFKAITIRLPADAAEKIKQETGMSVNAYMNLLYSEDMRRRGIDTAAGADQQRKEE